MLFFSKCFDILACIILSFDNILLLIAGIVLLLAFGQYLATSSFFCDFLLYSPFSFWLSLGSSFSITLHFSKKCNFSTFLTNLAAARPFLPLTMKVWPFQKMFILSITINSSFLSVANEFRVCFYLFPLWVDFALQRLGTVYCFHEMFPWMCRRCLFWKFLLLLVLFGQSDTLLIVNRPFQRLLVIQVFISLRNL